MRPGKDLATALAEQRARQEHERRRRVRAFANRLRLAAAAIVTSAALTSVVIGGFLTRVGFSSSTTWMNWLWGGVWVYLAALLLVFWRRTRLAAYLLKEHWLWLALLVGVPLDLLLLSSLGHVWVPTWLALVLMGSLLHRWRSRRAENELSTRASDWDRLVTLPLEEILLLRFPHLPLTERESG
ncbi:MAG TPA: hypothetical protein EYH31_08120 [Anaerolineae bacterium]|nr:hypothetical protein [Anaerolineae bacterium]